MGSEMCIRDSSGPISGHFRRIRDRPLICDLNIVALPQLRLLRLQQTSVLSQQQTSVLSQQQTSILSQQKTSALSQQQTSAASEVAWRSWQSPKQKLTKNTIFVSEFELANRYSAAEGRRSVSPSIDFCNNFSHPSSANLPPEASIGLLKSSQNPSLQALFGEHDVIMLNTARSIC